MSEYEFISRLLTNSAENRILTLHNSDLYIRNCPLTICGSMDEDKADDKLSRDVWLFTTGRPCQATFSRAFLEACGKPYRWRPNFGLLKPFISRAAAKVSFENCGNGIGFFIAPSCARPYVLHHANKDGHTVTDLDKKGFLLNEIERLFKNKQAVTVEEYRNCVKQAASIKTKTIFCPPATSRTIFVPQYTGRQSFDSEIFNLELD